MYPLEKVLHATACDIAVAGWVSSAESKTTGNPSTSARVKMLLDENTLGVNRRAAFLIEAKEKEVDIFADT